MDEIDKIPSNPIFNMPVLGIIAGLILYIIYLFNVSKIDFVIIEGTDTAICDFNEVALVQEGNDSYYYINENKKELSNGNRYKDASNFAYNKEEDRMEARVVTDLGGYCINIECKIIDTLWSNKKYSNIEAWERKNEVDKKRMSLKDSIEEMKNRLRGF